LHSSNNGVHATILGTRNNIPDAVSTQALEGFPKHTTVKKGVSQIMIMVDRNIINNNCRRTMFHGEPPSTNHNRQDPEPTIMESTEARNLSGNQTNSAGTNEDDERIIGPMVGPEEIP
jgi:hypothetical protein